MDWKRLAAMISKEFIQMRRDHLTFMMMVMIPLIQLLLFAYAINTNPKQLPTAIIAADQSPLTRTFIAALQNTDYFHIINNNATEQEGAKLLERGEAEFIVNIPVNFSRDFIRGQKPSILVTADATDPSAIGNAIGSLNTLASTVFNNDLQKGLNYLIPKPQPFQIIVHQQYNPEIISQYNIVPGLAGTVLLMTMAMITTLAITRERERGTMENLLATPVRPLEVMIGKIVPYIMVGYIQELLIISVSILIFHIPFRGSIWLLLLVTLPYLVADLAVGLTFSTIAKNQLQAVQMSFFFFLPSMLLSGFMFPFYGMPIWAQYLGSLLPLTHFLRIIRGIMLKGNGFEAIWPNIWPILVFIVGVLLIAVRRYKETLD